jgi:hypothetical protein
MSFDGEHSLYHVECDAGHLDGADIGTVGALARASVNVRRAGGRLLVVNASPKLHELIAFAGLDGVLCRRDGRQTEEREEPFGVEECGEPDDPAA